MNRTITLLVCLVLPSSWTYADDSTKANAKVATATALADKCIFNFPIDDIEREWKWGVSPAYRCEYSWMVTVKRGDASYQLGFSYFNPDAVPQSGTLTKLLATGQANVWKRAADGNGASYVKGVRVTCNLAGKHLRIMLDNEKWTKELFGDRPMYVRFETSGTQLKRGKTVVKVVYQPVSAESDG